MSKVEKTKKITASKRLEALEAVVLGFEQRFMILAEEIDKLSTGLLATTKTIDGILQATDSREKVNSIIINENIKEMEDKVKLLTEQGILIKDDSEEAVIKERSYIVGREIDESSNVINPRLHFAIPSLPEEERKLFIGRKVGEIILNDSEENKLESAVGVEILEVFDIKEQDEK